MLSGMLQLAVVTPVYVKVSKAVYSAPAIAYPYHEAYECNSDWGVKDTLYVPIEEGKSFEDQLKLNFGLVDVRLDHEDTMWWYYIGSAQAAYTTTHTTTASTTSTPTSTSTTQTTTATTSTTTTPKTTPEIISSRDLGAVMVLTGLVTLWWGEKKR